MATALSVIENALHDLGVLARGESAEAQEATDGLQLLNEMCNSWIHDDIDMEWITLTSTSDVVPYPDDQIGPIRYNLAMYMAPNFEVMPSPVLVAMAAQGKKQLRLAYLNSALLDIDTGLRPKYLRGYVDW